MIDSSWVVIGALLVAPLLWSGAVAMARQGAVGWGVVEPLDDKHEKAVLALMLAPIALGAVFLWLPREAVLAAVPPLLNFDEFSGALIAPAADAANTKPSFDWIAAAGVLILALYALGVVRVAVPLIAAHLRLRKWSAAAAAHAERAGVFVSEQATTPLAATGGRVLFPRVLLEALSPAQIDLIVDHERHHHARGDVAFYATLAWIEALLWLNPFVRAQTRHCRLAAELDCDATVTAAAPEMRKTYAETLLLVLKHAAGNALQCAPAVFSHRAVGEHRMRILKIMKSEGGGSKRTPWSAYVAALALVAPLAAAQLALAQTAAPQAVALSTRSQASSRFEFDRSVFSHRPLEGRLTGTYGARPDAFTGEMSFHAGVDIAAPMGAPVYAPANGRVLRVASDNDYGNMIEIDHGDGFAMRYAHLSAFDVRDGDNVQAGQVIGRVGDSGRSSGTHLHLEVWRGDRALDPQLVLDLPAQ